MTYASPQKIRRVHEWLPLNPEKVSMIKAFNNQAHLAERRVREEHRSGSTRATFRRRIIQDESTHTQSPTPQMPVYAGAEMLLGVAVLLAACVMAYRTLWEPQHGRHAKVSTKEASQEGSEDSDEGSVEGSNEGSDEGSNEDSDAGSDEGSDEDSDDYSEGDEEQARPKPKAQPRPRQTASKPGTAQKKGSDGKNARTGPMLKAPSRQQKPEPDLEGIKAALATPEAPAPPPSTASSMSHGSQHPVTRAAAVAEDSRAVGASSLLSIGPDEWAPPDTWGVLVTSDGIDGSSRQALSDDKSVCTVGRATGCWLTLIEARVSNEHARFVRGKGAEPSPRDLRHTQTPPTWLPRRARTRQPEPYTCPAQTAPRASSTSQPTARGWTAPSSSKDRPSHCSTVASCALARRPRGSTRKAPPPRDASSISARDRARGSDGSRPAATPWATLRQIRRRRGLIPSRPKPPHPTPPRPHPV